MGIFDKPQSRDGDIKSLIGRPVLITGFNLREDVATIYGPATAIDLLVKKGDDTLVFSGFSAGILRQLRQAEDGDFPTWARIENLDLGKGKSTLELVPLSDEDQASLQAAHDEDIPF